MAFHFLSEPQRHWAPAFVALL